MRVVVVSRIFAPERAAAAFRLSALCAAVEAAGVAVEVLTSRAPDEEDAHEEEARAVSEATRSCGGRSGRGISRWPVLRDHAGSVRGYLPYLSFDLPLLLRLAIAHRPGVVVVEPPPTTGVVVRCVLAARGRGQRRRVPYVYYAADVWSDASAATGAPDWVVATLRRVERYALSGATEVIAVSDGVAGRVRELGAASVSVVPNGVDTREFASEDPTPQEGIDRMRRRLRMPQGPFLLYAGTASEWQGAEIFAVAMRDVLREVPDATLVYLGQGSSWPTLQRIAEELPRGSVQLRPLVSPADAARWHRAARAAVVSVRPGIGYDFAYPTKVLAALACGVPVVYAGPGPAAADLGEGDLGTAVSYDVAAVAEAMVAALLTAPDEVAGERRVQWVQEHRSIGVTGATAAEVVLRAAHASR